MSMQFLQQPPRFLFFTGKGGVGKTSIACATAIELAEAGKRVLLVSTDPASNVGQVFGVAIGNHITPIPAVMNLSALEINPQAAAQLYREKIVLFHGEDLREDLQALPGNVRLLFLLQMICQVYRQYYMNDDLK